MNRLFSRFFLIGSRLLPHTGLGFGFLVPGLNTQSLPLRALKPKEPMNQLSGDYSL